MYDIPFHNKSLNNYKFLVTGGAGFIGSNLVTYLLKYNAGHVRVLDNLSNGNYNNITPFLDYKNFEFIKGDIEDISICNEAVNGMNFISHQAALGSVPRSIKDPINTNQANIVGFLNMLVAAKNSDSLQRMVYAASSSTYGDSNVSPKVEGTEGKPLSPYAVTKVVNELYADVFSKVYGLNTIGMRYFNVFGPGQDPNNPYAAVIPLFIKAAIERKCPTIFGDGNTSRDFTFIENVIQANIRSMLVENNFSKHEVINIGCGNKTSLVEIWNMLLEIENIKIAPLFADERKGDIKFSIANIEKARNIIEYKPTVFFREGLEKTLAYLKQV
jgi:UDP-N-acetylglucosamine 4-epimerase